MAPEQARDAANVGPAADIYSLGCTLYALVTGRPPFQGKSALEVMTKHAVEPVDPAGRRWSSGCRGRFRASSSRWSRRTLRERYQTIDEVIAALEGFLGIEHTAPLAPRPDEAELLEKCVQALDSSPSIRLRKWVFMVFLITCAAGTLLALLAGRPELAKGAHRPRSADALGLRHPRCDRPEDAPVRQGPPIPHRERTERTHRLGRWLRPAGFAAARHTHFLVLRDPRHLGDESFEPGVFPDQSQPGQGAPGADRANPGCAQDDEAPRTR